MWLAFVIFEAPSFFKTRKWLFTLWVHGGEKNDWKIHKKIVEILNLLAFSGNVLEYWSLRAVCCKIRLLPSPLKYPEYYISSLPLKISQSMMVSLFCFAYLQ